MGLKSSSVPFQITEKVTLDNFYSQPHPKSNIYQSRLSNSTANRHLIHKSISFTDSSQNISRYLAMLKNLGRKVECSNLYLPVRCSVISGDNVCSDYQTLDLYFEEYSIQVKEEIEARRRVREKFSEPEIWFIILSLIKGVRMFEKSGMSSGNLKTDKIILNDKGHVKVINALSYPEDQSNGFDSQYPTKLKRFYAPEELRALREHIDKRINPNIAETFSIGIIVLELTTFINGEDFYDMKRVTLNDYELKRADHILSQNYSKLLYNLTRTMLSGQYDRPLPSQIYNVFAPYQNRIVALKPFNFQSMGNSNGPMNMSNASLMSL